MDRVLNSKDIRSDDPVFLMFINKDGLEDKTKKKKVSALKKSHSIDSRIIEPCKMQILRSRFQQKRDFSPIHPVYRFGKVQREFLNIRNSWKSYIPNPIQD